jgi:hypothetical protein
LAREVQAYLEPNKYPTEIDEQFENKELALGAIKILNENLLKEVMGSEEQVESIRSSYPDAENAVQSAAFSVSKHTKSSCIDFLKDCDVEIDTWIDSADESEKVKKALKLFFTVSSSYNKEEWCKFPNIIDDETFWAGAK